MISSCSAEEQTTKTLPATCDEAVSVLVTDMTKKDITEIRTTAFEDLIRYHHGLGTSIRNAFGLWAGNTALMDDCNRIFNNKVEPEHPDTVSMLIIQHLWKMLNDKP